MIQKKICMLGAFGVGKTSLVSRFVHSRFSGQYHSTMGVKVDRKQVEVEAQQINMMLWDIHGEEKNRKVGLNYLRGSSGALLVADGTRPATLDVTRVLQERLFESVGKKVPVVLLINKHDLHDEWAVPSMRLDQLEKEGASLFLSSAKTGECVEKAFYTLGKMMLGL